MERILLDDNYYNDIDIISWATLNTCYEDNIYIRTYIDKVLSMINKSYNDIDSYVMKNSLLRYCYFQRVNMKGETVNTNVGHNLHVYERLVNKSFKGLYDALKNCEGEFLKTLIERYFRGDNNSVLNSIQIKTLTDSMYIYDNHSDMHMMATRNILNLLESLVVHKLKQYKVPTGNKNGKRFPLYRLVDELHIRNLVSSDFKEFMLRYYHNPKNGGLNMRNEIYHGNDQLFNEEVFTVTIFTVIYLMFI